LSCDLEQLPFVVDVFDYGQIFGDDLITLAQPLLVSGNGVHGVIIGRQKQPVLQIESPMQADQIVCKFIFKKVRAFIKRLAVARMPRHAVILIDYDHIYASAAEKTGVGETLDVTLDDYDTRRHSQL
jgi:hypothetical protein